MGIDPTESPSLERGTPITLWFYSQGRGATAKVYRGITAVGYVTATFETVEVQEDPSWRVDMEYHQIVDELLALALLLGIIAFCVKSFAQGIFRVIND